MTGNPMTATEQIAWSAAIRLGKFQASHLAEEVGVTRATIGDYLRRWVRSGRVMQHGPSTNRWIEVRPPEDAPGPRRDETPEQNMWRAMRAERTFGLRDLAFRASTSQTAVTEEQAARFVRALLRAGYLRAIQKAIPGRRPAVYRLLRDTGPLPPREVRIVAVFDPNDRAWAHVPEPAR
jgi:hypothetical protein